MQLTPNVVDVVEYQLPENVRAAENTQFVALIKHYYEWLTQKGQPTDFIQNILEYRDLDLAAPEFRQHITQTLLSIIPVELHADKVLITKHIAEFLKSKGTFDSFQFIMRAVYGEEIDVVWNSYKLFRASANTYKRDATVAIKSSAPWVNVEGSTLIQTSPYPVAAVIESSTTVTINGNEINFIQLQDKTLTGAFIQNGSVKALHNDINRNWTEVKFFYNPVLYSSHTLVFNATAEENRPYDNLIVKQVGTNFRAVVESFVSRIVGTNSTKVTLILGSETGTFNINNEIYIIPVEIEVAHYDKFDYEYGTVSPAVSDINIVNAGSLYLPGESVSFLDGSGQEVSAQISDVTTGGIDSIDVVKKGYGYSVGDELKIIAGDTSGSGLTAQVSHIDGINAEIDVTTELNGAQITYGGIGYKVNDEVEVSGGILTKGYPPARIRVNSVFSSWYFESVRLDKSGSGYPPYTKLALINTGTLAKITGFATVQTYDVAGGIASIILTQRPTISTNALAVIANGFGATAHATFSTGQIATIVVDIAGVNYIDPVVVIIGDGRGAVAKANLSGDTIGTITVISGGENYTTATITIKERYGQDATFTPLFYDQTNSAGAINTFSIIENGYYDNVPRCFDNPVISKVGTGFSATMSLNFKLRSVAITNPGEFYSAVTTSVSGRGAGAILQPFIVDGVITAINVNAGGTGYTKAALQIADGLGFVGIVSFGGGGSIASVAIVDGGQGYSAGSAITVLGDGAGATFNASTIANGVLKTISVTNGGSGYYYGTTISCATSGGVPAVITPTIVNGVIESISSVGSSGYVTADLANLTVNPGTAATLNTTISGTGKIVGYDILNVGSGYWATSEVTPLSITTAVAGSGASFLPTISSLGVITQVAVLDGGTGYTSSSTISVSGGSGTGASLKLVINSGKVTDVRVINGGSGYRYGSYVIVVGDGSNAALIPVIDTGITGAEVINTGSNYATTTGITVNDPTGTGAEVRPIVVDGKITQLNIIKKGSGYTNPTFTITTPGSGTSADLRAFASRYLSSITISNAGTAYTSATAIIVGDGINAKVNLITERMGSLDATSINNAGTGITSKPVVTITDNSAYGAVSGVAVTNSGGGYRKTPIVYLADKKDIFNNIIATGTKFVSYGSKVGGVRKVSFSNHGAEYNILPKPIFELKAIIKENVAFRVGETVLVKSSKYRAAIGSIHLLLEQGGGSVLLEDGSTFLEQDLDDDSYDLGLTATVRAIDYDRNLVELFGIGDKFNIITEDSTHIISENGIQIVDQISGTFIVGDILVGVDSGAVGTISKLNRAIGDAIVGGSGFTSFKFTDNAGILNFRDSVLADNKRYQDRGYVVRCGRSLIDYAETLKSTCHPAGFGLFGDVVTQKFIESNILNEIGYNQFLTALFIISLSVTDFGTEYSSMDSLFGEYAKFTFGYLPISLVKDYTIRQTSALSTAVINNYNAPTLFIENVLESWTQHNVTPVVSASIDNEGGLNTYKLTDASSLSPSYVSKDVVCAINDKISIELFARKQSNPLTYMSVILQSNELRINLNTGLYVSIGSMDIDVKDLGDYWFIRITAIATSTLMSAQIYPARGFLTNMNIVDLNANGNIEISDVHLRNLTGLTPFTEILSAYNSMYVPAQFHVLNTESYIVITP